MKLTNDQFLTTAAKIRNSVKIVLFPNFPRFSPIFSSFSQISPILTLTITSFSTVTLLLNSLVNCVTTEKLENGWVDFEEIWGKL